MNENTPETVPPIAQPQYINPRQMKLERQGVTASPLTRRFPRVIGGQCEWCGTLDPYSPGESQYKQCPHYRGMELRCVYCPEHKDQAEVVRYSKLNVAEHPDKEGTLVVWCDSPECSKKHLERFKVSL